MSTVVTSEVIKMDMNHSVEKLLKEVGIVEKSTEQIGELRDKISRFREANASLIKKADNLIDFGFGNTPTARNKAKIEGEVSSLKSRILHLQEKISEHEYLNALDARYKLEFPTYKFIPRGTMIEIMHKYDLILGETCVYGKEIPNYAITIMEMFKKQIQRVEYYIDKRFSRGNLTYFSVRLSESVLGEKKVNYVKSNLKIIAPESHFVNEMIETNGIRVPQFIVHPETREFEINVDKLNELVRQNTEVLDPILALEVEGGFIVLHAWDEEALIPEIQNPFLN